MDHHLLIFSPEETSALLLSFKVAILCSVLSAPLAIFLGWLFARKNFRGKTLLDAIVHIPMVLPPITVGYLLLLIFGIKGWIGKHLFEWFGLRLAFNFYAAILASIIVSLPLFVRAIRIAIEMADEKYEQAARTLGCGRLKTFWLVTLPLALPGVISGFILSFSRSLGEFGATMILAGNIYGETQTIPLAIYSLMQSPGGEAGAMRLAIISVIISIAAFSISEILARRCQRRTHGS